MGPFQSEGQTQLGIQLNIREVGIGVQDVPRTMEEPVKGILGAEKSVQIS